MDTYRQFSSQQRSTPQSQPIPGTVPNHGGGYSFEVDDWARLRRFLILGSEGSYYQSGQEMTKENAEVVARCLKDKMRLAVDLIADISEKGLAPKNEPALFALAMAASSEDPATRAYALAALPRVARIGTHLFHFAEYVNGMRGWGKGLRNAVSRWYLDKSADQLALQAIKYKQRDGWSHRDLLRLAHVEAPKGSDTWTVLRYMARPQDAVQGQAMPTILEAALVAGTNPPDLCALIKAHRLPRECLPTEALNRRDVWEALLVDMPYTALVRNLGKMASLGMHANFSQSLRDTTAKLTDAQAISKSRVHPMQILMALRTYQQGHGEKGKLSWQPAGVICDALDAAFYAAFGNVQPSGKNVLIGLDVSASMDGSRVAGTPLSAREAACAMAMVTARTEPNHAIVAFSSGLIPFAISPRERLDDVVQRARSLPFSATDCSLPMQAAIAQKLPVDLFAIYTDSETNTGRLHPMQALRQYRQFSGRPARLAVCAFTATKFSIADPKDAGAMDFAGLDASLPILLAEFASGRL